MSSSPVCVDVVFKDFANKKTRLESFKSFRISSNTNSEAFITFAADGFFFDEFHPNMLKCFACGLKVSCRASVENLLGINLHKFQSPRHCCAYHTIFSQINEQDIKSRSILGCGRVTCDGQNIAVKLECCPNQPTINMCSEAFWQAISRLQDAVLEQDNDIDVHDDVAAPALVPVPPVPIPAGDGIMKCFLCAGNLRFTVLN